MAGNKQPTTKDILIQLKGEVDASFKELLTSVKQLNAGVGDLNKTLSKNTAESLEQVNDKLEETSKDADDAGKKTKGLAKTFEGLGARIRTFAQYRVINAVASSIKDLGSAAIKLESNFANIQAITSATDTEMGKLRNTILRVGEASKYSVEEIASATTMLGQAGLSADEINNVLETTTQLAAGTGSELSNTVDLMTSALAVWGLNSEEASHLSDVMVTGMNRTKATLETFRMAVQYAGATMASLNVSFDEFASVAAAASNAGLRASVVGTGLRAMTSELISPTKKMVKGLAELGLSTEDVNIESQGLVNVLYKLKSAGLTAANAYDLFGKRAAQFVLAAQGQLDVVDELRVAFNESGATLKAYGTQMDTVAAEWTALGNTIKEAAYKILNETDGFIKNMLNGIRGFIKYTMSDATSELNESRKFIEDSLRARDAFSSMVNNIRKRDYYGDEERRVSDLNKLIKSMNLQFGLDVKNIDSVEDLGEGIERIVNALNNINTENLEKLNQNLEETRKVVMDEGFKRLSSIANTMGSQWIGGDKTAKEKYDVGIFDTQISIIDKLKGSFLERVEEFESMLRESKSAPAEIESGIKNEQSEIERLILQAAYDTAKSLVENIPSDTFDPDLKAMEESQKNMYESYSNIIKGINTDIESSLYDMKENVEDWTDEMVNSEYERMSKSIDTWMKTIQSSSLNDDYKQKLLERLFTVDQTLMDRYKGVLNNLINIFSGDEIKQLSFSQLSQDLQKEGKSKLEQAAIDAKERKKADTKYRRSQREIERDKARQFNLKYQGLAIQQQADSYQADIEQARRKGMKSRYDQLDKTGTIGSAYSRYSADKERLEKFKTAYANQETLDKYMKDYGDLFKQVESGKVSLEDADNKSDKLISKMIELQKSTEEARAEFGDLNETNLEDVNEQIAELDEKMKQLDEDSKTVFGQMKIGFQDAVKKMADTYSYSNLGATIAQDLGNGMADALNSIVDGSKSAKEAFSDMARSILQDISKMLIRMAVLKAMEAGVGMFGSGGAVPATPKPELVLGGEYANGGFIPKIRAATGAMVRGGIQGKDSVPAMLMPGEYVLKKSAVDALGTNFLNDLNNNAAQTLTNTAANMMQNPYESSNESEPSVVNVWVVSKEEEAKMGPNDVIATISKDIMTGGQTRRLIQSVVAGRK